MEDAPNLLVVLLSVAHKLGHFLTLALKLLLSIVALFLLPGHPLVEFDVLSPESAR